MRITKTLFLLFVFLFQANLVLASHCFPTPPPCVAFWYYDAIFVGTVTAEINDYTFALQIEKGYKGVEKGEVTVTQSGGWCGENFKIGKKYIVYALKGNDGKTLGAAVDTTVLYDENSDRIKFFESLNDGKPEYYIWVEPSSYFTPVRLNKENFRLEIWKAEEKMKSEENQVGFFNIPMLEAGKYKLRVFLPPKDRIEFTKPDEDIKVRFGRFAKQKFIETEVNVEPDKCGYFLVPLMLVEPD